MNNQELKDKVESVLKEKVEPALAEHFGGAQITELTDDGILYIKMTGACGTCLAAKEELEGSIKDTVIQACPEIVDVRLDDTVSQDMLDFAKQLLRK
ncbi:MAG: NifU family protein [Firmicutes bacterium]|nr:NifU family protein [Bacillota bacterium]